MVQWLRPVQPPDCTFSCSASVVSLFFSFPAPDPCLAFGARFLPSSLPVQPPGTPTLIHAIGSTGTVANNDAVSETISVFGDTGFPGIYAIQVMNMDFPMENIKERKTGPLEQFPYADIIQI